MVDQLVDLFHTTTKVKTEHVVQNRGQDSGDIDLAGYLDSTDPTLNGHLRYPNNLDQSLNDTDVDKIRKYRTDYNNTPPRAVPFMPGIGSTSGRLHREFIRLLFLQVHRETDRFFCRFRSSTSAIYQWRILPLSPRGVLLEPQVKKRKPTR